MTAGPRRYSIDATLELHDTMTLRNWWSGGEILRYVLLHMPEFFRHAYMHRDGPIRMLEERPRSDIAGMTVAARVGTLPLAEYVHRPGGQLNGFIMLHQGRIVYEAYPGMRPYEKHSLMSVTKAFVALVVRQLYEEGALDVDAPLETYLPELQGSGWEGVSVRDVLDMTSGIDCLELSEGAYTDPANPYYHFEAGIGWRQPTPASPTSTYAYVPTLKRRSPPGERFEYTSVNTFVLAWLAERLTGLALNELFSERIWRHIGAESDALLTVSRAGAPAADGGISATLRDLARFGLLFTPSWRAVSDEQVVSPEYVDAILTDGRPEIFEAGDGPLLSRVFKDDQPRHNAWQWDHVWSDGAFHKGGYGGQGLYVSPRYDFVVAFFGCPDTDNRLHQILAWTRRIERQVLAGA